MGSYSVILSLGISALMLDIIASVASFSCLSCLILELLGGVTNSKKTLPGLEFFPLLLPTSKGLMVESPSK